MRQLRIGLGKDSDRVQLAWINTDGRSVDPEVLLAWVMFGVRPTVLPAGHYAGVMPQFNYLSDADLAAILSYVRSSFGNQSSVITVEQVASVRSRQAAR